MRQASVAQRDRVREPAFYQREPRSDLERPADQLTMLGMLAKLVRHSARTLSASQVTAVVTDARQQRSQPPGTDQQLTMLAQGRPPIQEPDRVPQVLPRAAPQDHRRDGRVSAAQAIGHRPQGFQSARPDVRGFDAPRVVDQLKHAISGITRDHAFRVRAAPRQLRWRQLLPRQREKLAAGVQHVIKPPGRLFGRPLTAVAQLRDMPGVAGHLAA